MSDTDILPLHNNPQYIDQSAAVLNEEWPISHAARKHMLEVSNDKFPYSLILIERSENAVIGHSRLVRVPGQPSFAFVQSVVVRKDKRGKGLGRVLMKKTEDHALLLGIKTVYLTTHDKQDFYHHVGYNYCQPVKFSSSKLIAGTIWDKMGDNSSENMNRSERIHCDRLSQQNTAAEEENLQVQSKSESHTSSNQLPTQPSSQSVPVPQAPPPPPPPPLLQPKLAKPVGAKRSIVSSKSEHIYWMKKKLCTS